VDMSFFDDLPRVVPPMAIPDRDPSLGSLLALHDQWPRLERPPWEFPPRDWIGGWLNWRLDLIDRSELHVSVGEFRACPDGLQFTLRVRVAPDVIDTAARPGGLGRPGWFLGAEDDGRLGVLFADGRKAATGSARPSDRPPRSISLLSSMLTTEGRDQLATRCWLWPLPPPGPLTFVAEWPSAGVLDHRSSLEIDDAELERAVNTAKAVVQHLSPPEPPAGDSWLRRPPEF